MHNKSFLSGVQWQFLRMYVSMYFITCFDLVESRLQNQNEVLSKLENKKWTKVKIQCCFNCWQIEDTTLPRQDCRKRGAGGARAYPVNSISTWGAHYAHHIAMCPPNFQTLWWPCLVISLSECRNGVKNKIKISNHKIVQKYWRFDI